jgi:putative transposase
MSRKYKFRDNEKLYFVSIATVFWVDVFVRDEYKLMLIESLQYCQKHKGLEIYAWCFMPSHLHLIIGSSPELNLPLFGIVRDFKAFTSKTMREMISSNPHESRRKWLENMFHWKGEHNSNNHDWQFWQQHSHPIELDSNFKMNQKLEYTHQNPVKAGFVDNPRDWLYSSARDYEGEKGLLDILFLE